MTGEEALSTSRPVLFEHSDVEKFMYYGGGSSVFLSWQGSGYVVTATHVAAAGRDDQIRVSVDDVTREFFRFDLALSPKGDGQDWQDLTFFRIDRRVDPALWWHLALPVDDALLRVAATCYTSGRPLLVSGYPDTHRSIDYDVDHIALTRCSLQGWYDSPDPTAKGKHRIHIDADLESFNGLSGSPVFVEATANSILLAGILIQGSASSGLAQFIDALVLGSLLHQLPKAAA